MGMDILKIANKSDAFRCGCVNLMRLTRQKHLDLAKQDNVEKRLIDSIRDCTHFQIGQLEVTAASVAEQYTDELGIKMQTFGLVADGDTLPFVFKDKELVKNILDSRIGKIPMECLKLPFQTFIIELPEPVSFPDGTADKWDVCVIMNTESVGKAPENTPEAIMEHVKNGEPVERFIVAFSNSTNGLFMWFHFPMREVKVLDDGCLIGPDGEVLEDSKNFSCNTVSKAMLMIAKLVFFITSPNCKTVIEKRPKPSAAVPFNQRHYFQTVRYVSFDESMAREYEGDGSGRTVGVRHQVRGHFKHFTKGRLEGRVLWCPPHWRGPEIGVHKS